MKFKLKDGVKVFRAYGYLFTDEPVEVKEENLINKFKLYDQLVIPRNRKAKASK